MIVTPENDDIKNVESAIRAINKLCGHCSICSSQCPVAVARRAMESLCYDLQRTHDENNM